LPLASILFMTEFHIVPQSRFSLGSRELWQYRELFYFFTWRDVKVRYKQAVLGVVWAILQPLSMMLVFTLIFKRGLNISSDGLPYALFAFSGLMIWTFFASSLQNAASSMVANASIIQKIYFPRLIIPLSAVLTALFDWVFSFIIWLGLLVYFQVPFIVWKLIFIPLSMLLAILTAFGLGTLLASLNVKYRDFQYALPFFMQFLLFLNPVVYSTKIFANYPLIQQLMEINPIAGAINLIRSIFSDTPINVWQIALQVLVAVLFFITGVYYFRKTEAHFADMA
jgi:lipopolysaccharide transport system permease protein